jgi:hypothetical protein
MQENGRNLLPQSQKAEMARKKCVKVACRKRKTGKIDREKRGKMFKVRRRLKKGNEKP